MRTTKLKIKIKNKFYNIVIGKNLIKNLSKIIIDNSINFEKCLLVIDNKIPKNLIKQIIISLKRKKKLLIFLIQVKKIKIKKK